MSADDEHASIARWQRAISDGMGGHFAASLRSIREWREQHRSADTITADLRVDCGEWPSVEVAYPMTGDELLQTVTVGEVPDHERLRR